MNTVKVIHLGLMRNVVDKQEEEVNLSPETTVRELLHLLIQRHGNKFKSKVLTADWQLRPLTTIEVNNRNINEIEGLNTRLGNNSIVYIVAIVQPAMGG